MKVSMKQLLEAGVHFGHQSKRWNPRMKRYIFGERNGIYIIDLQKTLRQFKEAYQFIRSTVAKGEEVLFVGTKKQAQDIISEESKRCEMFYVQHRWLGGMLTNFATIRKSIDRMKKVEEMKNSGIFESLTKKEILKLDKQQEKMEKVLGGIKDMEKLPGALFVVDPKRERIAINEANKLEIPVVAIVDTNCDPEGIDYVIPGNDDAIRSIKLITSKIADAAVEGRGEFLARVEIAARKEQEEQEEKEGFEGPEERVGETDDQGAGAAA
jgi:small subunit ribosomal protein S2